MDRLFNPDIFFTIPDAELLFLLREAFAHELERLKNAYSVSDPNIARPPTPSPSRILYGADYDEVNRTLVSVLALRWLHNSQYDRFVAGQPESVRLTRESFSWMRQRAAEVLDNYLEALLTAVIINDLGKDPSLAVDYHSRTGEDVSALNHDAILLKACLQPGMVAALDRLAPLQRAGVMRGLKLGADFNYGQLAQTENAPAYLSVLRRFSRSDHDRRAVAVHFLEQLLDISGAAGHMDWTSARKLVEPIVQAYRVSHDVVTGILSGTLDPCAGYDLVLTRRADLLRHKGFRALDLGNADDRALSRLMCMGGVADRPTADLYKAVWTSLDELARQGIVRSLNLPGSAADPAVLPIYMPALLTQVADATNLSRPRREKERGLRSALLYLARVMTLPSPLDRHYHGAIVVERNVLDVLKNVVQNQAFCERPATLERADVPRGTGVVFDEA